jgi:hypothetical protein
VNAARVLEIGYKQMLDFCVVVQFVILTHIQCDSLYLLENTCMTG